MHIAAASQTGNIVVQQLFLCFPEGSLTGVMEKKGYVWSNCENMGHISGKTGKNRDETKML